MSSKVTTLESDEERKKGRPDSGIVAQVVNEEFDRRLEKLEKIFQTSNSKEEVRQAYEKTLPAFRARNALGEETKIKRNVYLTDYEFLANCYRYLTQTRNEGFCLVTGPDMDERVYTLSRRIEPEMKRQSPAGAEPDLGSLNKLLEKIDEDFGEHLSGYFHSHPGKGKGSTAPSSIDLNTQEKLERGGYPVVGCIFSRDGYFRFYSHDRDYQLNVSGNGGEQIEQRSFKLK